MSDIGPRDRLPGDSNLPGFLRKRSQIGAEKAVEERYPLLVATLGPLLRPSPQWPALAKLMNLPP